MLRPTYHHPLAGAWAAPGGPWGDESLDDVLEAPPEVEADVARVAGGLRAAGVAPGDAVAWRLPNGRASDVLFRASWRVGAVACPVHHRAGPGEVAALVARSAPAVFVDDPSAVPTATPLTRRPGRVAADTLAVALGTAGSTGVPKLVLHSHRALVHKARTMAGVHRLGPEDCVLMPAPFAHVSGLLNGVLLTACGLRVVPMARWEPTAALELVRRERVTFMVGPPTFFLGLMGSPDFSADAVRSLRQVSCGGAGVSPTFVREASARLGARVKRSYGSTEAPTVATSTLDDPEDRAAETDGRAVGLAELRAPAGGPGELLVRGPELFCGYDDPEATHAAFTDDGWFRTGDLATLDDEGWLTVVGRLKDVIIRGGENIATAGVEAVLEAHPDVRQAVVVGVPHRGLGEQVCAFVVVDGRFDLARCRIWFDEQGATRHTWPERVVVVPRLPLLPSGKPDRAALRRQVAPGAR